jgi:hypothetical protein
MKILKDIFNGISLVTTSIMPVGPLLVHGHCLSHYLKDSCHHSAEFLVNHEYHHPLLPHDDDEEIEIEPLNDSEEPEFNERPAKKKRRNFFLRFPRYW